MATISSARLTAETPSGGRHRRVNLLRSDDGRFIEQFIQRGLIMRNKKETVQAFLDLHKNEFLPMPDYVTIFSNMIGGVYGECRQVFDDKQLYELEISGDETKSGNPVLFTFRDFQ
tara:strand:- start:68 stop:415 length:348 start_codon:yes stop_codon:yes gene_type:complete